MPYTRTRLARPPRRHRLHWALGLACLASVGPAGAQVWSNPAAGSWFDAANWTPAFVPLAGGHVIVSNGGTALLAGVASTPVLGTLTIGSSDSGTGRGTVISNGVAVLSGGRIGTGVVVGGGSLADGLLAIDGAGGQAQGLDAGLILQGLANSSASGKISVAQQMLLSNGFLQAGQIFLAGAGSSASGTVNIGGNAGTVAGFLIAGNISTSNDAQVGSTASGAVNVGGSLALANGSGTFIGSTLGPDRSLDGTRFNRATGAVTVGGTLSVAGNNNMTIGFTNAGVADGSLQVGALEMAEAIASLQVGRSAQGEAHGLLSVGGGTLKVGSLFLGVSAGGTASGRLLLDQASLQAERVQAGSGGGRAELRLQDASATVSDDLSLLDGLLSLDRSLLDVGDQLTLGPAVQVYLGIDGLLRGVDFGAIDTLFADLAGALTIDLSGLVFGGGGAVFDLLRSGDADGIRGDFTSVSFLGLASGYAAAAAIELDGGIEVYRLRLSQLDVPEPASVALVLLALGMLARRRARPSR